MPISTSRMSTNMMEESQMSTTHFAEDDALYPPKLELKYFEEINEMFQRIKTCQKEENECMRKIDRINSTLEEAKLSIVKGKEARDTLKRRNEFLQDKLDQRERRIEQAVQYWKDYGFDVKQLSTENDPFEQYEFIYTKLPPKVTDKTAGDPVGPVSQPKSSSCSVSLKSQDKRLEVVEQIPEVIPAELLAELNERLTTRCVQDNGHVDYKLAMLTIKKDLIKSSSSPSVAPPKTSSHQ